jgi:hypothetical protein
MVVLLLLRLAGLALLISACFALLPALYKLNDLPNVQPGYRLRLLRQNSFVPLLHCFVRAGAGAFLCIASRRLTHWAVPAPGSGCLRCGHRMDPANAGVCPECGAA